MNELFINAIDLSPYIVGGSETGNVIGIKAPPELVRDVFLDLKGLGRLCVFFWDGDTILWQSYLPDELRGWVQIAYEIRDFRAKSQWLWLRFDE